MATAKKSTTAKKTTANGSENTSSSPKTAVEATAAAVFNSEAQTEEKRAGKVAVYYNHVRSIIFEVTDNRGNFHSVTIRGNGEHLRGLEMGELPFGGGAYARTPNIDADVWEAILAQYGGMSIFKSGLIYAVPMGDAAGDAIAKERTAVKNGYEPIDVSDPRRVTQPN